MVLTVGQNLAEILKKKILGNSDKIQVIYNGFDLALTQAAVKERRNQFELLYTGLLTENQHYKPLLEALSLLESKVDGSLVLRLAGSYSNSIVDEFSSRLPHVQLIKEGYVSHEAAVSMMKSAH